MGRESFISGRVGEDLAVDYLSHKGYIILERNFRSSQGEIDIIAKEKDFLVFIEVKNYSVRSLGTPLGALRRAKKDSIIHAATTYIYKRDIRGVNCRFDVLAIYNMERFELIKDAF